MLTESDTAPRLTAADAEALARELYGLAGEPEPLPSYSDQNFRFVDGGGGAWVLKVLNAAFGCELLEAQLRALEHLGERLDGATVPAVRRTRSGERFAVFEGTSDRHLAYLLSYLPGEPMADVEPPRGERLLRGLGRLVARVDRGLADYEHPALRRVHDWDLRHASGLLEATDLVEPPRRRYLAERYLREFEERVLPHRSELPAAVIHGDGNLHNALVVEGADGRPRPAGLLDFGDLAHTRRVFGPAIAAAYAALEEDEPLAAAAAVVAGYDQVSPLTERELDVVFPALRARLAVSVTICARERPKQPENEYLSVCERPAWIAMERLAGVDVDVARACFAEACGRPRPRAVGDARRSRDEILAARRRHLGPSFSLSYRRPLEIARGWMQYLFDPDGRPYLDAVNNVCHVGHCHPRVVEAVSRQTGRLNTNTRYLNDLLAEYAERLVATLPEPLRVCYFVCSGSEANDLALRLARAHTGQRGVVVLDGAYHGHTSALIELSPYKFDGPGGGGAPPHVRKVSMPDPYRRRADPSNRAAGRAAAAEIAAAAADLETTADGVAAFFCEPLLGCGGQVVPLAGYLEEAFGHVRRAGGVCVADEVQVGFGRVGSHFWAFETQGVVPDVVTLGKPIGNGHPLAAVVTTSEIAASFDNGMEYFNTFGGNPVSCAAGLAVLDAIADEDLQAHALEVGDRLRQGLEGLAERHELIGDVRGLGLFLGVELVRDRDRLTPAAREAADVVERLKDRGILLSTDGPLHNVLKIKPPLPFAHEDADRLVDGLDRAFGASPRTFAF